MWYIESLWPSVLLSITWTPGSSLCGCSGPGRQPITLEFTPRAGQPTEAKRKRTARRETHAGLLRLACTSTPGSKTEDNISQRPFLLPLASELDTTCVVFKQIHWQKPFKLSWNKSLRDACLAPPLPLPAGRPCLSVYGSLCFAGKTSYVTVLKATV